MSKNNRYNNTMNVCSNYDCMNTTPKNRLRCGRCRFSKITTCSDCGDIIYSDKAMLCNFCKKNRKANYHINYQRTHKKLKSIYNKEYHLRKKQLNKTKEIIIHG
jgi:RecJ-like exonuclease